MNRSWKRWARKLIHFSALSWCRACSIARGGRNVDHFDVMTTLIDWVEAGVVPERIEAARIENGEVVRTRPLCSYPEVAVYEGNGSTDEAENFTCQ